MARFSRMERGAPPTLGAGEEGKNLQVLITSGAAGHGVDTTRADFVSMESKRHGVAFLLIWPIFKGPPCDI